ncbi:glycosyltransferase (plasmid) [Haloferacaceae archaeon DSL9]
MQLHSSPDRSLDDYATVTGRSSIEQIRTHAEHLDDIRVLHLNSTASGGGVAELLSSIVPLCNDVGVGTDWGIVDANDDFFEVTKALHNGLQGRRGELTGEMKATYRSTVARNAESVPAGYDIVVLHDPQTVGMISHLRDRFPETRLVWRCHIDFTEPAEPYLGFVLDDIERADHVVFTRRKYGAGLSLPPSTVVHPSIDPLTDKNRLLTAAELETERERLEPIAFEGDAPVIAQVSRYDPWKGQSDAVDAYRRLKPEFPELQLVFVGGMADDDPEGPRLYERLLAETADDPDIHLLTTRPDTTVNFVQRHADVVLQKSTREGFGLIVSEALWKQTPVVGSNIGGIPLQIDDGKNGYLVEPNDVEALADRAGRLLADDAARTEFGRRGREAVRDRFLLPRHLLEYLELFDRVRSANAS